LSTCIVPARASLQQRPRRPPGPPRRRRPRPQPPGPAASRRRGRGAGGPPERWRGEHRTFIMPILPPNTRTRR